MVQQKDVIIEALKEVPKDSILYLCTDAANYYMTMYASMEFIKNSLKMRGIYISAARSADKVKTQFELEKIDVQGLYFVDTIAILSGARLNMKGVQMVESPAMLETILLKTKWFLRHLKDEERFVFLDSINTLGVYNESKVLCEFLHVLINLMSARDVMTILLAVEEQTPQEVKQVMRLTADDFLTVKEEGVSLNGILRTSLGQQEL